MISERLPELGNFQIKSNQIYWTTKGWKPLTCC